MKHYWDVLRSRGVARLLVSQLVARFPAGMLSLAILMHIQQTQDSYTAAGIALAALAVGQAIAGPVSSRLMSRLGMRRVLVTTILVCALALVALALLDVDLWVATAIAAIAGLTIPPIPSAVRTIYPKIVNSRQLTPLFSLDASLQEIIWVLGPVVVTFVAFAVSPAAGILLSAGVLVAGGAWFVTTPAVGQVRIPRSKRRMGQVLANPVVRLMGAIGFLLVGSSAAIEASTVAEFGHERPETGIVLAVYAVGSLVGGLLFGHLPVHPWSLARRMGIVALGIVLALFSLEAWWLGVAFFVSGIGMAPVFAGTFAAVSTQVRFSDTAEAYGWIGTGQLIGAAAGSALAGVLIDAAGPIGGFWVASAFGVAGVVVTVIWRGIVPDLRGLGIAPRPDTEPLPTVGQPG